jgi:hypothetical protein
MAIEFLETNSDNQRRVGFSVDESRFIRLSYAIDELRAKTGVFVDPYGKTRLAGNHARLLAGLLRQPAESLAPADKQLAASLADYLENVALDSFITVDGE